MVTLYCCFHLFLGDDVIKFTNQPIDPDILRRELFDPTAGAYIGFEGWIRNENEGYSVEKLEYEVYEPLAISEGEKVITEAVERFAILHTHCVHRTGMLEIGECAVWIGVSSEHRDEAFNACRYIIDQVKVRLPIWKKEYYTNGNSDWVNCERCTEHAHTFASLPL